MQTRARLNPPFQRGLEFGQIRLGKTRGRLQHLTAIKVHSSNMLANEMYRTGLTMQRALGTQI